MSSQEFEHDASKFFKELLANTPRSPYDAFPLYSTSSTNTDPNYHWQRYEMSKVDENEEGVREFNRAHEKLEEPSFDRLFEQMHEDIQISKKYLGEKLEAIEKEEAEENKEFQFDPEDLDL
jgi:hypothetical protein